MKYTRALSFSEALSSGETSYPEPNLLRYSYQSLNELGEGICSTLAGSSLPHGRREIPNISPIYPSCPTPQKTEKHMRGSQSRGTYRLTERLRSNHITIECSPLHLTTTFLKALERRVSNFSENVGVNSKCVRAKIRNPKYRPPYKNQSKPGLRRGETSMLYT